MLVLIKFTFCCGRTLFVYASSFEIQHFNLEVFYVVLQHLKEEMKLSYLAREFIIIDRLSPQAWCVL